MWHPVACGVSCCLKPPRRCRRWLCQLHHRPLRHRCRQLPSGAAHASQRGSSTAALKLHAPAVLGLRCFPTQTRRLPHCLQLLRPCQPYPCPPLRRCRPSSSRQPLPQPLLIWPLIGWGGRVRGEHGGHFEFAAAAPFVSRPLWLVQPSHWSPSRPDAGQSCHDKGQHRVAAPAAGDVCEHAVVAVARACRCEERPACDAIEHGPRARSI
mmetsp:Transcript_44728/g.83998  ORF Transcript_44728/g.83998 Transcript_44728/m.83998 type:complete len:210 (-) Transcript_44728:232-861(-)